MSAFGVGLGGLGIAESGSPISLEAALRTAGWPEVEIARMVFQQAVRRALVDIGIKPVAYPMDEYRDRRAAAQAAFDAGDRSVASVMWREEDDLVVAACPKYGIVCKEPSIDEALAALNEARALRVAPVGSKSC